MACGLNAMFWVDVVRGADSVLLARRRGLLGVIALEVIVYKEDYGELVLSWSIS